MKVGIGLWNYARTSLVAEYLFYAVSTLIIMPLKTSLLLVLGSVFTLASASPLIGSKKANSKVSISTCAIMAFVGFVVFALIASYLVGAH
jgi:uncharacterized membrane protein